MLPKPENQPNNRVEAKNQMNLFEENASLLIRKISKVIMLAKNIDRHEMF